LQNILDTKKNIVLNLIDITHSNIQDIGIALSVSETIRNVSTVLKHEVSVRATYGASRDLVNPNNPVFLTFQNMELICVNKISHAFLY
jgi:outer membrane receptor for monomeric catechols